MKKKILSLILTISAMCAAITGCGGRHIANNSKEPAKTTNEVIDDSFNNEDASLSDGYDAVPTVNINTDAEINIININGTPIDLDKNPSLEDLLSETNLSHNVGSTNTEDGLSFHGALYSINTGDFKDQTKISIELENHEGEISSGVDIKTEDYPNYTIKGIHTSLFFTENDFNVYYCDSITNGSTESHVESILGKGDLFNDDMIAYNNGTYTMLISYEEDTEGSDEPLVDGIYLLRNNTK